MRCGPKTLGRVPTAAATCLLLTCCPMLAPEQADGGTAGADGGGAGASSWTAIALPNDTAKGLDLPRGAADKISGIHFESTTSGLVCTASGLLSPDRGGAIYRMAGPTASSGVAFSGAMALSATQSVSFQGLHVSGKSVVALTDREEAFVASADYGTFTLTESGKQDLADVLWLAPTTGGTWWLLNGNQMALTASQPPSAATSWTVALGPKTIPTVPDPYPANWCSEGPTDPSPGWPARYVHLSADGARGVYAIAHLLEGTLQVCVWDGASWTPRTLPDPPAGAVSGGNLGIASLSFVDDAHGWVVGGNEYQAGAAYVYRTSDGGETWSAGAMPEGLSSARWLPHHVFFAPDGQHGWIVGFRGSGGPGAAVLLSSGDGGATWGDLSGEGINELEGAGRLFTGFALDAENLWVGGETGFLAFSDRGGRRR